MTTYLLDANVLLAFHDTWHVYHQLVRRWFTAEGQKSWATCPLTENAFVRIASHPSYPNEPGDVQALLSGLRRLCSAPGHSFWADGITITAILDPQILITHAHVTDVYLLALAAEHGGKLATLDGRIPVHAVQGGSEAIEVLTR